MQDNIVLDIRREWRALSYAGVNEKLSDRYHQFLRRWLL